jgi:hypothetical protein
MGMYEAGEGDTIRVTWGPEKFAPVAYHTLDVGPFVFETRIRKGESEAEAFQRAWQFLDRMGRDAYAKQMPAFLERVKQAGMSASKAKG